MEGDTGWHRVAVKSTESFVLSCFEYCILIHFSFQTHFQSLLDLIMPRTQVFGTGHINAYQAHQSSGANPVK